MAEEISEREEIGKIGETRNDIKEEIGKIGETRNDKEDIIDVDYAILRSIKYVHTLNLNDIEKEIRNIASVLQLRVIIVEKRIYRLVKNGFVKFNDHCIVTQKGEDAISKFEQDSKEWMTIDSFIVANMENKKERDLKTHKIIDKTLLTIMIILAMLVIYVVAIY